MTTTATESHAAHRIREATNDRAQAEARMQHAARMDDPRAYRAAQDAARYASRRLAEARAAHRTA